MTCPREGRLSVGDAYFVRRGAVLDWFHKAWQQDPVISALWQLKLKPERVLEIGCANGWRLDRIKELFGCHCCGVDPSQVAITSGRFSMHRDIEFRNSTACDLGEGTYDVVIFGFCLYLCRREDLFKAAYEADRVLEDGGHLVIYDFHPENDYSNGCPDEDQSNYKMQYFNMFVWHPYYRIVHRNVFRNPEEPTENLSVYIFQKKSF